LTCSKYRETFAAQHASSRLPFSHESKTSRDSPTMMAFDRTPSRPALEPHTVEVLREALARSVRQGNHVENLRDILCNAAEDARSKNIQAEQLLLILKDIWYSLPEVATKQGAAGAGNTPLLQELISRCIQEYYSV
jgi:hypothetical protein